HREAAVAAAGAVADLVALDHDDVERRLQSLEVPCRGKAGEAAAEDGDVGPHVAFERRLGPVVAIGLEPERARLRAARRGMVRHDRLRLIERVQLNTAAAAWQGVGPRLASAAAARFDDMRSPRRTRARSEDAQAELRARILENGRRLFLDKGFDAVSLRAIASSVGLTPAALYTYFPSKLALLRAIWTTDLEELYARVRDCGAPTDLRRQLHVVVAHWLAHPDVFRVLFLIPDR